MATIAIAGFAAFDLEPTVPTKGTGSSALVQSMPSTIAAQIEATTSQLATVHAPPPRPTSTSTSTSTSLAPTKTTPTTTTMLQTAPPVESEVWRTLVKAHFPSAEVDQALVVLWCESRGSPDARHPSSGAAGLFQHLPKYWPQRSVAAGFGGADIYDPEANVGVAAWLATTQGWYHWNASKHCWG